MIRVRTYPFVLAPVVGALTFGIVSLSAASAPSVPSFAQPMIFPVRPLPRSLAIGDLSGDGKLDIVTASSDFPRGFDGISVLLNKGRGSFNQRRDYSIGKNVELRRIRSRPAT